MNVDRVVVKRCSPATKDHKPCRRRALLLVDQLGITHSRMRTYAADNCTGSGLTECVFELDELLVAISKLRKKLRTTNGRGQ